MTAQTKNLFLWSLLNFSLSYNALFSFGIVLKPLISMADFSLKIVKMKVSSRAAGLAWRTARCRLSMDFRFWDAEKPGNHSKE